MKGFLVAGTASGVGKTTVTLALIAALRRRGLVVQPFKGGPDFLDTGHHTRAAGRVARNVDTWMLSAEANLAVVQEASAGADVVVVEGMMGLFDGKDGTSETGSSAEIAKLLKLPVVLVLDAGKSARSVAAVVLGFELFDAGLTLAGVVLNRVAGESHFRMLQAAIGAACRTPVLGWLPRDEAIAIPGRHLGLRTVEEEDVREHRLEALAAHAERHLEMDRIAGLECGLSFAPDVVTDRVTAAPVVRIGVARDLAFSFYYEDNLDLLRQGGAEIVFFSPLADDGLPEGLDGLYLGGGYPELYAERLSGNASMRAAMAAFARSGRPVYAECGGMMYLGNSLTDATGETHAMAGVLPFGTEMTRRLVRFGYVTIEVAEDCLIGDAGTVVRGHSFHYSQVTVEPGGSRRYVVTHSMSGTQQREGYGEGKVLASYVHLHFRSNPEVARRLVAAMCKSRAALEVSA
jgi:cobyrinic acid a,c-diamide synthase